MASIRATVVAVGVLGACVFGIHRLLPERHDPTESHVSSSVVGHFRGLPSGMHVAPSSDEQPKPRVARAPSGRIFVVTWGSGSCPSIPSSVSAADSHRLIVETEVHDFYAQDDACTGDLSATTSILRVPDRIDAHAPLAVELDGVTFRLAPLPA